MLTIKQGDSGGPVMQPINGRWYLVGVVSNGDKACSGKGIYTNVAYYVDWINMIVDTNMNDQK